MATVPSSVPGVHFTNVSGTGFTVGYSAPYDGGAAIDSYQLTAYFYNLSDGSFAGSVFVNLAASARSGSINYSQFAPGNWGSYLVLGIVNAHNSVGWSVADANSRLSTTPQLAICRAAGTPSQSLFETVAVAESNTPLVTPPSAFGVAVRANQAVDFVFAQLASQTGRPDPDTLNVDPYQVMTSNQPIIRLALGTSDVVPGVTDSEQLAGEIPTGGLASSRAVVAHTSGASSFTLTKTWVSDLSAQIYTMAVLNNLPIAYVTGGQLFQAAGSIRRTLIWTYDIPTPIGVGPGDTFTTTVTIAF